MTIDEINKINYSNNIQKDDMTNNPIASSKAGMDFQKLIKDYMENQNNKNKINNEIKNKKRDEENKKVQYIKSTLEPNISERKPSKREMEEIGNAYGY